MLLGRAQLLSQTFEIGLRKSLGARRSDILLQFLVEAGLLGVTGGVLGLALAALLTVSMGALFSMEMPIRFWYAALAISVSGGFGLFAGVYPAFRASKIDPILALNAER